MSAVTQDLRDMLANGLELITYSPKAVNAASDRATRFLIISANIADAERDAEEERAKLTTLVASIQAHVYAHSKTDKVTEKKIEAENNPEYATAREALETCEAEIKWLKAYARIFENAHITYRQFSKE